MPKHWTPEGLRTLSESTRAREQWRKAHGKQTGPRTVEGKLKSAQRGTKHGARSQSVEALKRWISSLNRLVKAINRQA